MNESGKNIPLTQAGEDPVAKLVRQKIGDILDLGHAPPPPAPEFTSSDQEILQQKIIATLKSIFDPEIPLNIYDLGLIYRLSIDPANAVKVEMTLTAPGCPVTGDIVAEVKHKVEAIPEIPRVEVELVWDPPWTRDRLSEAARLDLGLM